jgi:hypothetical protein
MAICEAITSWGGRLINKDNKSRESRILGCSRHGCWTWLWHLPDTISDDFSSWTVRLLFLLMHSGTCCRSAVDLIILLLYYQHEHFCGSDDPKIYP